ncbi:hypothetical protein FOXG_00120 [Fusarium oxysporum f. sp. lycopersici 4287]|uniref:Uncharacterized protein n=2 Tax=Fusarium oxysporum TaxID=5507 RepID=A0A0J9U3S0_FUSO4|nr:hypothetical protein FOXG_00120 [Fusarium oxysporum f. sp. lycopersici 4287]KNA93723.1 hypothetical protein FOXG_00120 [Fusarium oxysporum f. sp. lycopersici 4287]
MLLPSSVLCGAGRLSRSSSIRRKVILVTFVSLFIPTSTCSLLSQLYLSGYARPSITISIKFFSSTKKYSANYIG